MSTLLSVVIPTHNRARYAIYAIRSILAIDSPDLELVISDTSTDGELEALVRDGENAPSADPRFKYHRPTERLDMTGNHNFAVAAAQGEYICLIGDDDTITEELLQAAQWAHEQNIDVIAPNVVSNYVWPDFKSRHFGYGHAARLYVPREVGKLSFHACTDSLALALENAAQGTDGLPKIYHGLVRKSTMDKLRELTGNYFHGSSPDVAGAVGLTLCTDRYVVVDYPLTIPGASGGSNTGRSAMNKHKGKLSQESQTKAFENAGWSEGVPRFFSVETVWAHAALETLAKADAALVRQFNFARLIGVCSVLHKDFAAEIAAAVPRAVEIMGISRADFDSRVAAVARQFRRQRLWHLLRRALRPTAAGGRAHIDKIMTVADAPAALRQHMAQHGWSWQKVLKA